MRIVVAFVLALFAASALIRVVPTSLFITPIRLWAAEIEGKPMIRFERHVLFAVRLRWRETWIADDATEPACPPRDGVSLYSPTEIGPGQAMPWPPHCVPDHPGIYTIYTERRLCLIPALGICTAPIYHRSDPIAVLPDGSMHTANLAFNK